MVTRRENISGCWTDSNTMEFTKEKKMGKEEKKKHSRESELILVSKLG